MKNKNFVLSMVFMAIMFLFLLVGAAVLTDTMYDIATVIGFACIAVSAFFWCRFELPKLGNRFL